MSVPGLWRKVPGYLTDKTGPFVIRWRCLPRLLPWLIRFLLAGSTWKKIERNAVVRYELCRTTMEDHLQVAAEAGVSHLIVQKGQLRLYRDKSEYLAGKRVWDLRRRMGFEFTELEAHALHRLEPTVEGAGRQQVHQVLFPEAFPQGLHVRGARAARVRQVVRQLTFAEQGYPEFSDFTSWQGIAVSPKVPAAVVEKLYAATRLVKDRILVSAGPKSPATFNFPLDALSILLPNLYPEAAAANTP